MHALAEQLFFVRGHGAGVGVQVFVGAKLQGIYENTDDDHVAQASCLAHEVQVTFMQITHGGYKSNRLALLAKVAKRGL